MLKTPVIIKIKSTHRMIPVKGKLVRTPCEIIVDNKTELENFKTIFHAQGMTNFTIEEIEIPLKRIKSKEVEAISE